MRGVRGSGLPIIVVTAVTPWTQVKTPCSHRCAMLGFGWRAPRRLAGRPDDASNCENSLIFPNMHPTYSYHTYKHYILYSLMLAFISLPETSHGEPGPDPTHKQVIQSIFPSPVPASLYRMFLEKNVSLPSCTGHESKTE